MSPRMLSGGAMLLGLLVFGSVGATVSRQTAHAASPGMYIALGDSVAAGVGSSLPRARSYPALVDIRLQNFTGASVTLANLARPGETVESFRTDGQLDDLRQQVALANAAGIPIQAVTVTLGGNEILEAASEGLGDREATLTTFQTQFDGALGDIRASIGDDTPLVVTNYYDPTGGDPALRFTDSWWIDQFNGAIATVAQAHGAALADVRPGFVALGAAADRYPVDVHPTNAGHAAIAAAVWKALALDTQPPDITVVGGLTATTRIPTLRLKVADPGDVAAISVTSSDATTYPLVPAAGDSTAGTWLCLVDASTVTGDSVSVTIDATDAAGNSATTTVMIALPEMTGAQP